MMQYTTTMGNDGRKWLHTVQNCTACTKYIKKSKLTHKATIAAGKIINRPAPPRFTSHLNLSLIPIMVLLLINVAIPPFTVNAIIGLVSALDKSSMAKPSYSSVYASIGLMEAICKPAIVTVPLLTINTSLNLTVTHSSPLSPWMPPQLSTSMFGSLLSTPSRWCCH